MAAELCRSNLSVAPDYAHAGGRGGLLADDLGQAPQSPAGPVELDAPTVRNAAAVGQITRLVETVARLNALQKVEIPQCVIGVSGPGQRTGHEGRVTRPDIAPCR